MKRIYKMPACVLKKYAFLCFFLLQSCGGKKLNYNTKYETTTVSFYADKFVGKKTSSGQIYSHSKLTASSKNLPFGTKVEIVNIKNNKSVIVTVNDRGPLITSREFDLSQSAFKKIAKLEDGIARVKFKILK